MFHDTLPNYLAINNIEGEKLNFLRICENKASNGGTLG